MYVGVKHRQLCAYFFVSWLVDFLQCTESLFVPATLVRYLGQVEPDPVAQFGICVLIQEAIEAGLRLVEHAIGKLQAAQQQFRFLLMVLQLVLLLSHQQVCDGSKVILLVKLEQDFTVLQVTDLLRFYGYSETIGGYCQPDPEQQELKRELRHYHSLTSNSG